MSAMTLRLITTCFEIHTPSPKRRKTPEGTDRKAHTSATNQSKTRRRCVAAEECAFMLAVCSALMECSIAYDTVLVSVFRSASIVSSMRVASCSVELVILEEKLYISGSVFSSLSIDFSGEAPFGLDHRIMDPIFCDTVVGAVRRMVSEGYEAKRAWTTALFFTEGSPARTLFNHKGYGIVTSNKLRESVSGFYEHVVHSPSVWFSGPKETQPKKRMLSCAKATFEGWHDLDRPPTDLVRDALFRLTSPFAHDSRCGGSSRGFVSSAGGKKSKKRRAAAEGGPKMFFLASPWQMLKAIPRAGSDRDQSMKAIGNVKWPGNKSCEGNVAFDEAWMEKGQPVLPYPTCSTYAMRSDETLPTNGKHEYFFTLDVDGINALSTEQEKGGSETRDALCERVIAVFQNSQSSDAPALLSLLSDILTRTFERVGGVKVAVSWHKTFGYKPSWRAYVVGAMFRDNYEAKAFVNDELKDECLQMFREHLPDPFNASNRLDKIVDCGTYVDGWDRCLGSAKLNTGDPTKMRFLQVNPLTGMSNPSLVSLFNECPNRYLLTVLGWMYPEEVYQGTRTRDSFVLSCEPTAGTRSLKATLAVHGPRSKHEGPDHKRQRLDLGAGCLDSEQNARLSEVIAASFEKHGFVHPQDAKKRWTGIGGVVKTIGSGTGQVFEMQGGASEFMLCVYRNCGIDRNHTPRAVKPTFDPKTNLHSAENSRGKINYKISITDDQEPWITQNCFKCGGEHGHKMQFICPVAIPPGMSLVSHVMGTRVPPPTNNACLSLDAAPDANSHPKKDWSAYYIPKVMIIVNGELVKVF